MAKKSILYIITKSVWGGAGKYVFDLSDNMTDNFRVLVAAGPALEQTQYGTSGNDKLAQKIKQNKIPYYNISGFQRNINPLKDFFAFFEILSLLLSKKPDIIHINSSKAGLIAGLASWAYKLLSNKKINLIFTVHGWAFNEDRPNWQIKLIKLISKITCFFYNRIICVSKHDRQAAIKNKIAEKDKLITIHNGIDLKKLSFLTKKQARRKLINKQSDFVIGAIAEFTKNKGLIYLLEAIKKIQNHNMDLVLIGSGENPDKQKIHQFIKKNNLKNIYLFDFIDNAASYLKAFDIFVLPSIKEGLPYTIIEAMAAQSPIIATNVGGISELINNNASGILIKPKNSQQLAEKILFLKNNKKVAEKLAIKARQKAQKQFSLTQMLEKTKQIY